MRGRRLHACTSWQKNNHPGACSRAHNPAQTTATQPHSQVGSSVRQQGGEEVTHIHANQVGSSKLAAASGRAGSEV